MYLQKINLKNKYALVTGAGKGLGRACSIALAEAGATVIALSRTPSDLNKLEKDIKKVKGKIIKVSCDVMNYKDLNEKDQAMGWLFDGEATDATSDFQFKAIAGYAQYRHNFSTLFNFKANFRIEQNNYYYNGLSQGYNENWEKVYLDSVQFKTNDRMVGFRAAFTYNKNISTNYFSTFTQGYKSGGINQQPYLSNINRTYDPEYVRSFEFGLKQKTNKYRSNFTLFLNNRINQQVSVSSQQDEGNPNSFLFYTANAGSGKNFGIEFDHSHDLITFLSFNTSIGILLSLIHI